MEIKISVNDNNLLYNTSINIIKLCELLNVFQFYAVHVMSNKLFN